jgi:hypothetical protein
MIDAVTVRSIFRETALDAYRRGTNKDVVPRLTSRPIIVCMWLLLGALVAATSLASSIRVPAYVGASGVILGSAEQVRPAGGGTAAVLFVPPDQSAPLHSGQPVQGQVGSSGAYVHGAVATVEPGVIGPDTARNRYGLADGSDVITRPSNVVIVRLEEALPPTAYGGSSLTARVEVGSQRLLGLIPGRGEFFAGG